MKSSQEVSLLGLAKDVLEDLRSVNKKHLGVHFGGPTGRVVGYIYDWGSNRALLATPACFASGDAAVGYLNALLGMVRQ